MNNVSKKSHLLSKGASTIVLALVALGTAWAQDSTVTTIQHGPSSYDTQVKNAEVVYAENDDLVLKVESGRIEHLVVPDSDRFTIDGKEVSVQELVPGTEADPNYHHHAPRRGTSTRSERSREKYGM